MELEWRGEDADIIQPLALDARVLGMSVNEARCKLANHSHRVHALPYQVRRIVVEAEIRARDLFEHAAPDLRADGEVLAAGPFIIAEQHWTVFNADLHSLVF